MNGDITNGNDPLQAAPNKADFDALDQIARAAAFGTPSPAQPAPGSLAEQALEENQRLRAQLTAVEAERDSILERAKAINKSDLEAQARAHADEISKIRKAPALDALAASHLPTGDQGSNPTGPQPKIDPGLMKAADEFAERAKKSEAAAAQLRTELQHERALAAANYAPTAQYLTDVLDRKIKTPDRAEVTPAFHSLLDAIVRELAEKQPSSATPPPAAPRAPSGRHPAAPSPDEIKRRKEQEARSLGGYDSELAKVKAELALAQKRNEDQGKQINEQERQSKEALAAKDKKIGEDAANYAALEQAKQSLDTKYKTVVAAIDSLPGIAAGQTPAQPLPAEFRTCERKLEDFARAKKTQDGAIEKLLKGDVGPGVKIPGVYAPIVDYIKKAKDYDAKVKEVEELTTKLTDARKKALRNPGLNDEILRLEEALTGKNQELENINKELILRTNRGKIAVDYARAGIASLEAKEYGAACDALEKALTANQGDPRIGSTALYGLASIAADLGDRMTAQAYASLLLQFVGRIPGQEAQSHEALAKIYERIGDDRAKYHREQAEK